MYISWYFEIFPKLFLILSFVFNGICCYLNLSDGKKSLGKYSYFLLSFSIFNLFYSVADLVIPMAVYGSNYVVLIYLSGGPFFENIEWGQQAVSVRGGFIALSYGTLTVQFFYRYVALFNPTIVERLSSKLGIFVLFMFFLSYGVVWVTICELFMFATDEARNVTRLEFRELFDLEISEISFLNIVYKSEVDDWTVLRCWIGLTVLFFVSIISICCYCVIGFKIMKKLREVNYISKTTRRLHRQLLQTLATQTTLPTIISFLPCMIVWVLPLFGVHLANYGNIGVVTLSTFPALNALAVIILLPIYRNRLTSSINTTSGNAMRRSRSTTN